MKKLNILAYGAVELKRQINSSTIKGFVLSLMFFAIVGLIPSLVNSVVNDEKDSKIIEIEKTITEVIKVNLGSSEAESKLNLNSEAVVNKVTSNQSYNGELTENLIPVDVTISNLDPVFDDSQLIKEIADINNNRSGNKNNVLWNKGNNKNNYLKTDFIENEDYNKQYNHKNVQKNPGMDYDKLKSSVKYPSLAKEMNLSGVVHVAALIQKDGKLIKSYIYKTTNSLFNEEALKAINEYNDFSPAFQNERAVDCWIIIPIKFKIK